MDRGSSVFYGPRPGCGLRQVPHLVPPSPPACCGHSSSRGSLAPLTTGRGVAAASFLVRHGPAAPAQAGASAASLGLSASSAPRDRGSTVLTPPPQQPGLLPALLPGPPHAARAVGGWAGLLPRAPGPVDAQRRPRPVLSLAHAGSAWAWTVRGEPGSLLLVQPGGRRRARLVLEPRSSRFRKVQRGRAWRR